MRFREINADVYYSGNRVQFVAWVSLVIRAGDDGVDYWLHWRAVDAHLNQSWPDWQADLRQPVQALAVRQGSFVCDRVLSWGMFSYAVP